MDGAKRFRCECRWRLSLWRPQFRDERDRRRKEGPHSWRALGRGPGHPSAAGGSGMERLLSVSVEQRAGGVRRAAADDGGFVELSFRFGGF